MRARFENMSEEERQKAMSQMGERFDPGRRGDRRRGPQQSEEERQRIENMSEEEREQYRAQMRNRPGGGRRSPGGGGDMFRDLSEEEREQMREKFQNMSEEERREYMARMRENRARDANE